MSDRDVFDALAGILRARETPVSPVMFEGGAEKTAAAISVYRNNVRASLSKALGEKFPAVAQLVGEEFFKFAANEYFNAAPPASPLIADYGDTFPAFLQSFEPARSVPYLADIARLEIIWLTAYRAADAEPLDADAIMAAGGGDPSRLVFTLHPSLRLFMSQYPIGSIWRRHKEEAAPEKIIPGAGECVMIVRPEREVQLTVIGPGIYAALRKLQAGETVAAAFQRAFDIDREFDPQETFQIIFNSGAVIAAAGK